MMATLNSDTTYKENVKEKYRDVLFEMALL